MKKTILIDASPVIGMVDGLSQYIYALLKYLPEDSFDTYNYRLLINKYHNRPDLTEVINTGKFDIQEGVVPLAGPKRDWWFYNFVRKYQKSYDLIHITSSQFPFAVKSKGVATVHDLTMLYYYYRKSILHSAAPLYFKKVIQNCLRNATAIIAVSEATKKELLKLSTNQVSAGEKTAVIYEGWEHLLGYGFEAVPFDDKDYIFYLGSSRMHKNLNRLVQAFARSLDAIPPHVKLVISGKNDYTDRLKEECGEEINKIGPRIFFTGYLTNEQVATCYKNAGCFIFPSLAEGFGIPVLESFYYKTPLLCSNCTSIPEVAGDACIYFDPLSVESIADAIVTFYADPKRRDILIKKGAERLTGFSWAAASAQTVDLYKKVLNN